MTYRRAFGAPVGSTNAAHERFRQALAGKAAAGTQPDGRLVIDWTFSLMVARLPA